MTRCFSELDPPVEALAAKDAQEVLRFWIADGIDHLALRINAVRSADGEYHGAEIWGSLLADVARHVVNAFEQDFDNKGSQEELYAYLYKGFNERLSHKAGDAVVGKLQGLSSHAH